MAGSLNPNLLLIQFAGFGLSAGEAPGGGIFTHHLDVKPDVLMALQVASFDGTFKGRADLAN